MKEIHSYDLLNVSSSFLDHIECQSCEELGHFLTRARDKLGEFQGDPVGEIWIWSLRGEIKSRERSLPVAERVNKLIRKERVA